MSRRAAESAASVRSPKQRRLSARDVVLASPTAPAAGGRVPVSPVYVTIHKWADKATEILPAANEDSPVWQLQVVHENRPSVTFGFLAAIRAYLPELRLETLEELEERKHLRIVIASGQVQDPDGVGVKPWRVAVYSGSATPIAALEFLAGFLEHVGGKPEFGVCGPPALQIHAQCSVHIGTEVPEPWTLASATTAPSHAFDAAPPRGRRHLVLTVEKEVDSACYSFMVSGNTWQYRNVF